MKVRNTHHIPFEKLGYRKPLSWFLVIALLFNAMTPIGYMAGNLAKGEPLAVPCPSYFGSIAHGTTDSSLSEHQNHHHHTSIDHSNHQQQRAGDHFCLFTNLITVAIVESSAIPAIESREPATKYYYSLISNPLKTTIQHPPSRGPPSHLFV